LVYHSSILSCPYPTLYPILSLSYPDHQTGQINKVEFIVGSRQIMAHPVRHLAGPPEMRF
jgi:hypothetical protein